MAGHRGALRDAVPLALVAGRVNVETPNWVRDAVFYQIFPDRFARERAGAEAGTAGALGRAADDERLQGRRPARRRRASRPPVGLGVNAIYFNPVFQSASNHRYHTYDYMAVDPLLGGDAALRELLDACHARGHPGRARRRVQPREPRVLAVPPRPGDRRASPYRDWFYLDAEVLDAGRPLRAYPTTPVPASARRWTTQLGRAIAELGYRAWWDLPALPKLNADNPAVREYLLAVAEHWIRFGIDGWRLDVAEEVDDELLARSSGAGSGPSTPTPTSSARSGTRGPEWLRGRHVRRADELPARPCAILGFVGGRSISTGESSAGQST